MQPRLTARVQSAIVNRLRLAAGGYVTEAELIEALWGGIPDGGPEWGPTRIKVAIFHLRQMGYPIENRYGAGYRYAWTEWEIRP